MSPFPKLSYNIICGDKPGYYRDCAALSLQQNGEKIHRQISITYHKRNLYGEETSSTIYMKTQTLFLDFKFTTSSMK